MWISTNSFETITWVDRIQLLLLNIAPKRQQSIIRHDSRPTVIYLWQSVNRSESTATTTAVQCKKKIIISRARRMLCNLEPSFLWTTKKKITIEMKALQFCSRAYCTLYELRLGRSCFYLQRLAARDKSTNYRSFVLFTLFLCISSSDCLVQVYDCISVYWSPYQRVQCSKYEIDSQYTDT